MGQGLDLSDSWVARIGTLLVRNVHVEFPIVADSRRSRSHCLVHDLLFEGILFTKSAQIETVLKR